MLRKILFTTFIVVIILVIAAVLTPMFIPASKFRQTITEYAQEMIGHNISIGGDIEFKAFPYLGINMQDVTVGKPESAKSPPLAKFKALNVEIATLPLFTGAVVVKSLTLDEPQINLIVFANGKQNWLSSYDKPEEKKSVANNPGPEKAKVSSVDVINNLMLDDVQISHGSITYKDEITKKSWALNDVNVAFFLDSATSPFEIKGDIKYNESTVKYSGTIETFQTLMLTGQAKVGLDIRSEYITAKLQGNLNKNSYSGRTEIATDSLIKTVEWINSKPLEAVFSSKFPLRITSKTTCSPDACSFMESSFALDSIEAKGDVKVKFTGSVPHIEMQIDSNQIDFNLFKTEPKKQASSIIGSAYAAEPAGWSSDPIDFSGLRSISMIANINTGGIKMDNVTIGKTVFRSKIQHGRLSLDILDAEFYSGKANIFVNVDASSSVPVIEKRITFSDVQMEPFLRDINAGDRFSGKGNLQLTVVSMGNSEQQIVSNLRGNGNFKCEDGAIKGINIAEMVRNVQSAFKPVDKTSQKTDFSEVGGAFTIAKGIVSNNDLIMKAPLFRVKGNGTVDLPQRTINYRLLPELVETIQGQGGKEKQGIGVPVLISGSWDNLSYRPDLESTIKDVIKNPEKAKETIGNIKEQIKQNKEGIKDLLKKF